MYYGFNQNRSGRTAQSLYYSLSRFVMVVSTSQPTPDPLVLDIIKPRAVQKVGLVRKSVCTSEMCGLEECLTVSLF